MFYELFLDYAYFCSFLMVVVAFTLIEYSTKMQSIGDCRSKVYELMHGLMFILCDCDSGCRVHELCHDLRFLLTDGDSEISACLTELVELPQNGM